MPNIRSLLPVVLFVTAVAQNSGLTSSAQVPTYITHVTVIDTKTGNEAQDRTVVISGDRILEVTDSKRLTVPPSAKAFDATGKYLIPGLWDMHVHAVRAERIETMFPMFVANGVLGIRDMGTDMRLADVELLRKQIADGSRIGPRIVATGQILDGRPAPASATFVKVRTAVEGRAAVEFLKTAGADFVKVYTWLPRDAYFAIAKEAKKQGIPFEGHVPMSVTALEASDAGQKSIEHLNGIDLICSARENEIRNALLKPGSEMSDSIGRRVVIEASASYSEEKAAKAFTRLTNNHTWQVPTFVAFLQDAEFNDSRVTDDPRLKYIPSSIQKEWSEYAKQNASPTPLDRVFERHLAIADAMHRAGIQILAGTDTAWRVPFTYAGFSLHDELALLVRAGLTPAEALQSATIDPARFLGIEKDLGAVEKGKIANLVLLNADPLDDIHNTTKISEVFLAGKEFDRVELDQMLRTAEASAKGAPAK
jgi:imidazolonepropionase-like amidohydrolase